MNWLQITSRDHRFPINLTTGPAPGAFSPWAGPARRGNPQPRRALARGLADGEGFACDHRWSPDLGDGGRRRRDMAGGLAVGVGDQIKPLLKPSGTPQQGLADKGASGSVRVRPLIHRSRCKCPT